MLDFLKGAIKNLTRKKVRTALTVIGISIGVTSVMIIETIASTGKYAVNQELDSIGLNCLSIRSQSSANPMTLQDVDSIKEEIPTVADAMPVVLGYSSSLMMGEKKDTVLWGVGSNAVNVLSLNLMHGRFFTEGEVGQGSNVCLIGHDYALEIYKRTNVVGKKISVQMDGASQEYEIIGIIDSSSNILQNILDGYMPGFVYLPYTSMHQMLASNQLSQMAIKLTDQADSQLAGEQITKLLDVRHRSKQGYIADDILRQKERLNSMFDIVTMILSVIGSISLVVAGLSIMTVMLVSVHERTREIGIKKAIGAKEQFILIEFITEALALSLFGSILGVGCGLLLTCLAGALLNFAIIIQTSTIIYCICFATITGLIFGVYPAYKAAKLKPVDALKND